MYRSDKAEGTIVYVGGLVGDVKKEDLEAEFEKFGTLTRVWVAFNPPGFAFVEFEKKEDAEASVDALHNADILGSKVRVEISRGRGKGGRGGFSSRGGPRGRGQMRGMDGFSPRGRGGFRGRGDFGGGRGEFRGRGMGRGGPFGGFGGGRPFDHDEGLKPFRGGDMGRFDDLEDLRRPEYPERDFGARRDFRDIDSARGYPSRDLASDPRDFGGPRDFPSRGGMGDYLDGRDVRSGRDYEGGREFDREVNGFGSYGGARDYAEPMGRGYGRGRDLAGPGGPGRDYGPPAASAREYGALPVRDAPVARGFAARDYPDDREVGMRREGIRDFNPPRDLGGPRDFGARPSRSDYAEAGLPRGGFGDGDARRAPGFNGGRFGGNVSGSGDYGGYGARDRFRSRSPIPRGSRPLY